MYQLISPTQANMSRQLSDGIGTSTSSTRRLIVLIPDSYFNPNDLAERIWQLSSSTYPEVLLVGLCSDPSVELMLRRQLVSLAAFILDNSVAVEILMETKKRWSKKVEQLWQPGDLVAGLTQKSGECYNQELSTIQQSNLQIPVHILTDLQLESYSNKPFLLKAALWLGAVGIMAGFFVIQIQIDRLPENWGQTVLLYSSVFAEIVLLWAWNLILE